jgi:death on curing protein
MRGRRRSHRAAWTHLELDDLFMVADAVTGGHAVVRDVGLVEAALARPQASAFGEDAYPSLHHKAAALLHPLARNHAANHG